uniref:Uncharacterized protein n=1 Tax=Arundo donax TaxID=35708 RepID=A0A0A9F4U9_ARUDO
MTGSCIWIPFCWTICPIMFVRRCLLSFCLVFSVTFSGGLETLACSCLEKVRSVVSVYYILFHQMQQEPFSKSQEKKIRPCFLDAKDANLKLESSFM